MRLGRLSGVLVAAIWLSGCSGYYNDFDIINGTKVGVRDVSVSDGGTVWKLGDIAPGAKTTFHGHFAGEDTGTISWTLNGKRYSADGCFYTVGSESYANLTIVGDHLDYRCT